MQVWAKCGAPSGPGCAGHLVFQRAVAVRHAGVARRVVTGLPAILPDERHGDGARYPVLLGGPHDHDGAGVYGETPFQHGLPPRPGELPSDDDNVQRFLVYLKYWTPNLTPLVVCPIVLLPPSFIIKTQRRLHSCGHRHTQLWPPPHQPLWVLKKKAPLCDLSTTCLVKRVVLFTDPRLLTCCL